MYTVPQQTELGELKILRVFDYYDGPVLFLCSNELDHKFLTVFVDESRDSRTWYYLPLSKERLKKIKLKAY